VLDEEALMSLLRDETGELPEREGRYRFHLVRLEASRARIVYRVSGGTDLQILLVDVNSDQQSYKTSDSFKIFYSTDPNWSQENRILAMEGVNAVVRRIQANDQGGWILQKNPRSTKKKAAPIPPLLWFGLGLFGVALLWLPVLMGLVWRRVGQLPRAARSGTLAMIAMAGVLRVLIVPHLVVTMYMGYMLTQKAVFATDLFRYGPGAQAVWHSLFRISTHDHRTVIALHAVVGTLNIALLVAILVRAGLRPLGILFATAMFSFLPMLIWADASDSLTVLVLFWTLGATLMAQEYLDHRKLIYFWGALIWLGMAANTRPEQVLFGPLFVWTVLMFQAAGKKDRPKFKLPWDTWLLAITTFLLLALPQIVKALQMRAWMMERGSWPHSFLDVLPRMPRLLVTRNALLDSSLTPLIILPLALLGLFIVRSSAARRFRVAVFLLGVVWMSFYYIDLSIASLPRLHVVLLIPAVIVVADLFDDLWSYRSRAPRWVGPGLLCLASLGVVAGIPPNVGFLWQDTNERQEDRFFREAIEALPRDANFIFVRGGSSDRPSGDYTHDHYPDYLLQTGALSGEVSDIGSILKKEEFPVDPVFFFQGVRCYSRFRQESEDPPPRFFAPACKTMHERFVLKEVIAREVPNLGDIALRYYPSQPTFKLALYRVVSIK
jgi:hypothetical protein